MKAYSELYTVDDWIEYFNSAGRMELKATLRGIKNNPDRKGKNKRDAINALLA